MVKIPSLDELKKMSTDMMDKVKGGIESMSKKGPDMVSDETLKSVFEEIYLSLNDAIQAQAEQAKAINRIQNQLNHLAKIISQSEKPTEPENKGQNEPQ